MRSIAEAGSDRVDNYWRGNALALAESYLSGDGVTVALLLTTRAIQQHAPGGPLRVLDIGGGDARQAIRLAHLGHEVHVLDPDAEMLAGARSRLARQPCWVRKRVRLVAGDGERAPAFVGGGFDVVCCHSVLLYFEDPAPLIGAIVACTADDGLISVTSTDPRSSAMRSGLQERWSEAIESLRAGFERGAAYLPSGEHPRELVEDLLRSAGARPCAWYGIGVFTDHHQASIRARDPREVIEAEWLAGCRDPYRSIARCYHVMARKPASGE